MDCSLPHSSIHGILQTRVLEWVVNSFSRGSSHPRDRTQVSCIVGRCFAVWATTREINVIIKREVHWPECKQINKQMRKGGTLPDEKHNELKLAFKKPKSASMCHFGRSTLVGRKIIGALFSSKGIIVSLLGSPLQQDPGKTTEEWWGIYYKRHSWHL